MSKPLGFYTSYTPGDGSPLEQLQEQWGAYFEKMTQTDKAYILHAIAENYYIEEPNSPSEQVQETFRELILNLPTHDQLGIAEALINQIRYTPSAELPPKD